MATHTMNINPASYEMIADGRKTLEVRLRRDGVETYLPGDTLIVKNRESGATVTKEIARVTPYMTLRELVDREDLTKNGAYTDPESFTARLRSFQTEDEERQYGLSAIELE